MESKVHELSDEVMREARETAYGLGFLPMREKPGYDQIGMKGEAYVIDRATEAHRVIPRRVIERDGRPWVRPKWPKAEPRTDYALIGWRVS